MQSSHSFVSAKDCFGQCNMDVNDKSKDYYDCAAQSQCMKKSLWTAITNEKVQLSQKRGTGMYIKSGNNAYTSVKTGSIEVAKVGMVLATGYQDRSNLQSQMSLSMSANNADGYVNKMAEGKHISKNQFAFYFSASQNFMTVGNSLDYLVQGKAQVYSQSASDAQWTTYVNSLKLDNDNTMNAPLIAAKKPKWVFDANTLNLLVPEAYLTKLVASYPTCEVKADMEDTVVCKCKGDLKKVPSLSVRFDGSEQYWTLSDSHMTTVKDITGYDTQACVTRIQKNRALDNFVAGRAFLEQFYTVFSNSPSQITISQVNPVKMTSNQQSTGLIVTMLLVGLLFILLALVCLCCLCFKNIGEFTPYTKSNVAQEAKVETRVQQPMTSSVYRPQQQVIRPVYDPPHVVRTVVEQPQVIYQEPVLVSQQMIPSSQMMSSQQVIPGQII